MKLTRLSSALRFVLPGPGQQVAGNTATRISTAGLVLVAALVVFVGAGMTVGAPGVNAETETPVALHADLPDTLDTAAVTRFGLFPDVPGIQALYFLPAPWGGYLARIVATRDHERVLYERNVPQSRWLALQQKVEAILANRPVEPVIESPPGDPDSTTDATGDRIRTWPEVPVPPALVRTVPEGATTSAPARVEGRWLAMLEFGYRHNISEFNEFYTDMGAIGVAFGYGLRENLIPYFGVEVGFGDIKQEFENWAGDGRANAYGFVLGLTAKKGISERSHLYLSGAGGYFLRSLQWGDPYAYQYYYSSSLILEQQDWGYEIRAGILLGKSNGAKPRFWDLCFSYQTTPADPWEFPEDAPTFTAHGRDSWVSIAIRIWDGI